MKVMVLNKQSAIENNPLIYKDLPIPEPTSNQVQIKINACGICHTDLHIVEGDIPAPKLPLVPGHQIVGIISKIGTNVTKLKIGDKVGVPWLNFTCGQCHYCNNNLENLCDNIKFTGYNVDGGYAEYSIVDEKFTYLLPKGFPDLQLAPLLCGGIIGYRALKLSEIKKGGRLGLFGFGASAHIAIQIAKYWDCEVYVFTRSNEHKKLAEKLGAIWTGSSKDKPPKKIDSAVIFAPAGELVIDALGVLRKGGTMSLAGIYMTPIPEIDYNTLLYYERTIRSVANSTRQDAIDLISLAAQIPIQTKVQTFSLYETNKALQLLKKSEINGAGVLKIT